MAVLPASMIYAQTHAAVSLGVIPGTFPTPTPQPEIFKFATQLHRLEMPPRLGLIDICRVSQASSFIFPVPSIPAAINPHIQQHRSASILSSLSDNPSAYHKRIRRGRGPSSGKGKTSGRGHKGQKQHGKVPAGFQGGQTPEWIVHGKRGFKNL